MRHAVLASHLLCVHVYVMSLVDIGCTGSCHCSCESDTHARHEIPGWLQGIGFTFRFTAEQSMHAVFDIMWLLIDSGCDEGDKMVCSMMIDRVALQRFYKSRELSLSCRETVFRQFLVSWSWCCDFTTSWSRSWSWWGWWWRVWC